MVEVGCEHGGLGGCDNGGCNRNNGDCDRDDGGCDRDDGDETDNEKKK